MILELNLNELGLIYLVASNTSNTKFNFEFWQRFADLNELHQPSTYFFSVLIILKHSTSSKAIQQHLIYYKEQQQQQNCCCVGVAAAAATAEGQHWPKRSDSNIHLTIFACLELSLNIWCNAFKNVDNEPVNRPWISCIKQLLLLLFWRCGVVNSKGTRPQQQLWCCHIWPWSLSVLGGVVDVKYIANFPLLELKLCIHSLSIQKDNTK